MAIQNDDWDIRKSWLYTEFGGNGDYYIVICDENKEKQITKHNIRVTTSGSRYNPEIMMAVAALHRTLEKHKLNSNVLNKEIEFPVKILP